MRRTDSFEKTLMLGKIEGGRRRGRQRMRLFDGITDSMDHEFEPAQGDSKGQGNLSCFSLCGCKELGMTEQQQQFDAELKQRAKYHPFSLSPPSPFSFPSSNNSLSPSPPLFSRFFPLSSSKYSFAFSLQENWLDHPVRYLPATSRCSTITCSFPGILSEW